MSGAQSISTRRAYGVQRVCRVWHRARSSVYARRQATRSPALCRRRGPIGAAPDDVLVAHIRRVLEASPFHGEGYRKAWAKLRVAGMRTSKERVRRLMREHDLQAPPRAGHAHGPKAHDGTITTEAPDVMWGTDMTATVTVAEGAAFVFVAVDHCAVIAVALRGVGDTQIQRGHAPVRVPAHEVFREPARAGRPRLLPRRHALRDLRRDGRDKRGVVVLQGPLGGGCADGLRHQAISSRLSHGTAAAPGGLGMGSCRSVVIRAVEVQSAPIHGASTFSPCARNWPCGPTYR